MARPDKYTQEEVIEALRASGGLRSLAAERLGCKQARTVSRYVDKYDACRDAAAEAEEKTGDFVESKLIQLIKEGNVAAIIFYCKTKLKKRGYVERQELTGKDGENIEVKFDFK